MGWFRSAPKPAPEIAPTAPAPEYKRFKNKEWITTENALTAERAAVQVLQDLRDELKALNKRMESLEENFKLVFGIEEKNDESESG